MKRAFISGATGFLGRHLVDVLIANNWQVTALCRDPARAKRLLELGVDGQTGSIEDREALRRAMPMEPDAVFHLAANTSTWRGDRERQFATNVEGTENMLKAAAEKGARRFIHTSSTAVYGHHPGPKTEQSAQLEGNSRVGYVKTKWLSERLAKEAAEAGQSVVILNPGHILGAYDTHNWARMFLLVDQGTMPGIPSGSGSFANAREVAAAHLAAVERGVSGENYLLGGPHHSFMEVLRIISGLLDKPIPKRVTPGVLIWSLAFLGDLVGRFTKKEPKLSPEAAHFLCNDDNMDSSKAAATLGYREVPIEQSLRESWQWLTESGLLESSK